MKKEFMEKIRVSNIKIDGIRKDEFVQLIPELYELRAIVENNNWHKNESVFSHTLKVLERLEELTKNTRGKIRNYLNQKIKHHSRKDLLFLAALFHDIAKKETIVKEGNMTSCQKHEEKGAIKARGILSRFDLSEDERDFVVQLVKSHGVIHLIVTPENDELDEEFARFKKDYSDICIELILLAMADTLGSHLRYNRPDEFDFRINFYGRVLGLDFNRGLQ